MMMMPSVFLVALQALGFGVTQSMHSGKDFKIQHNGITAESSPQGKKLYFHAGGSSDVDDELHLLFMLFTSMKDMNSNNNSAPPILLSDTEIKDCVNVINSFCMYLRNQSKVTVMAKIVQVDDTITSIDRINTNVNGQIREYYELRPYHIIDKVPPHMVCPGLMGKTYYPDFYDQLQFWKNDWIDTVAIMYPRIDTGQYLGVTGMRWGMTHGLYPSTFLMLPISSEPNLRINLWVIQHEYSHQLCDKVNELRRAGWFQGKELYDMKSKRITNEISPDENNGLYYVPALDVYGIVTKYRAWLPPDRIRWYDTYDIMTSPPKIRISGKFIKVESSYKKNGVDERRYTLFYKEIGKWYERKTFEDMEVDNQGVLINHDGVPYKVVQPGYYCLQERIYNSVIRKWRYNAFASNEYKY